MNYLYTILYSDIYMYVQSYLIVYNTFTEYIILVQIMEVITHYDTSLGYAYA